MNKEDAILTAYVFMLDHGEEPGEDMGKTSAELCPAANVGSGAWDGGYGQNAKLILALRTQENRAAWRVDFWPDFSWLPSGMEVLPEPIHVWVDDLTGEAWWVEDEQPTQTSWRQNQAG